MVAIRLIATDLDDTLLRVDKTISQRAYDLIQRAQAQRIHFVPVTARPPRTMREIGDILGVNGVAICCNGALVYDIGREAIIQTAPIAPETTQAVIAVLRAAIPGIQFGWEAGMRFGCEPGYAVANPITNPSEWRADASKVREPLVKLMALHPAQEPLILTDLAQTVVGELVTVTNSGLPRVEMSALGVDKGSGLAALCVELGVPREAVVAFGDMLNDIAMLRWAGTGVAVANAHPDVLAAADAVTLACAEDGVAAMLERLLLG